MTGIFPLPGGEPRLRIHILTDGAPLLSRTEEGLHRVDNALIGKDFHWSSRRALTFRGEMMAEGEKLFNIIGLEQYLESVVGSEMRASASEQFLKAHAIISRSWALGKKMRLSIASASSPLRTSSEIIEWDDEAQHSDCDLCNDDHCQRYQGVHPGLSIRAAQAVSDTAGLVLSAPEGLVDARFSKCCGGRTELFSTCWQEADPSYLQSVVDPYCDLSDMPADERRAFLASVLHDYDIDTPFDSWSASISKDELRSNIRSKLCIDPGPIRSVSAGEKGPSGRLRTLIVEADRTYRFGKELIIRRLLSPSHLFSSLFTLTDRGQRLEINGRGWGHGVGLCQIGAARMASLGFSAEEILLHYYPGTSIIKAY